MENMSKTTATVLAAALWATGAGTALAQSQEIDDARKFYLSKLIHLKTLSKQILRQA